MNLKLQDSKYRELIENVESFFHESGELIWDRRNKIKIIRFQNEKIVVKSFKKPHWFNRIIYSFFRDSKAKRSYENSILLEGYVPEPVGYVEQYQQGLFAHSYFLSAYYPYDFTIREVLTQDDFPEKEKIFESFARFTYLLHEKGAEHLDYSPGNILIRKDADRYDFKVIDINRMRFGVMDVKRRVENFSKLWAKENDLALIIKAYARLAGVEESEVLPWALEASRKHKARVNMKKRLKGKAVVD